MKKILVLGSTGFVGKNVFDRLSQKNNDLTVYGSSRNPQIEDNYIFFDLANNTSWRNVITYNPDYIVDCTGYGVVKHQSSLELLYDINYLLKRNLIDFLVEQLPKLKWIQIGTAFEYDLEVQAISENTPCLPKTHYGISKLMFSEYLQKKYQDIHIILRPFGMFGPWEDLSKFFPLLIKAQKEDMPVHLSDGSQSRDYFFVQDLANFIFHVIHDKKWQQMKGKIINLGSNEPQSLRQLSHLLGQHIPNFKPELWQWAKLEQRNNENDIFFNQYAQLQKNNN